MIEKLLLFMREVHNKKIHSYPKDVLIAAVIFAAAVCQWGGNHGKAAETVSFAALEDIAEKKVAILLMMAQIRIIQKNFLRG